MPCAPSDTSQSCTSAKPDRADGCTSLDGKEHDFYVGQLWDWKASIELSTISESGLPAYTRACGSSLARAHARSGDRLAIAGYLGAGSSFDKAIARFSAAYADQTNSTTSGWLRLSPRAVPAGAGAVDPRGAGCRAVWRGWRRAVRWRG